MLQRHFLQPESLYAKVVRGQKLYSPVVILRGADHVHVYLSGRTSALPTGELVGKGDMRAQIRQVCENIKSHLEFVGATLEDVLRTVTYVTDIEEYFRCMDERFKYFTSTLPTSTLLGVSRLGNPDFLVEIEAEAIIEPERLRIPESGGAE